MHRESGKSIEESAQTRSFRGMQVCHGAPYVNHLFFADDSLIFGKFDNASSHYLLDVLNQYAKAIGQCINTEKTTITFSQNIRREVKDKVMAQWGYRAIQQYKKYLGLPPIVCKSKKRAFSKIKS